MLCRETPDIVILGLWTELDPTPKAYKLRRGHAPHVHSKIRNGARNSFHNNIAIIHIAPGIKLLYIYIAYAVIKFYFTCVMNGV